MTTQLVFFKLMYFKFYFHFFLRNQCAGCKSKLFFLTAPITSVGEIQDVSI